MDLLVAPGGKVTVGTNGAFAIGIKVSDAQTLSVTVHVELPEEPFIPVAELAAPTLEVESDGSRSSYRMEVGRRRGRAWQSEEMGAGRMVGSLQVMFGGPPE